MIEALTPEHRDVITTGGQVLIALFSLGGIVFGGVLELLRREVVKAKDAARTAADRSAPTGNGYAARTEASLDRIEAVARELRVELRAIDRRHDHLARRLDRHLEGRD